MATLVLSTVGTALGGSVGSAIGALIGQSIDQALLTPVRRGPRVGDLSVQTSSYGTQIPRIYGAMRIAGTVVWATDLVESEQTDGAKGQPDVTYSYSVSLAVALSSRPASRIARIWADGKLLRGAAGDFKVDTEFRFYGGDEDQIVDPLIGSIEGIAATPAYRGLALAVFENLQLADFGNRIPLMTFEIVADDAAPTVGAILVDASRALIDSDTADTVIGFAAYGHSIRSAVKPLIDCFGVKLLDDGNILRSSSLELAPVSSDELGNSADGKQAARIEREQVPARELPTRLRLTYYDPDRDYQTGEAQAAAGERSGADVQEELAAVLDAGDAKSIAHRMIARIWSDRDRLTLRLPPSKLAFEPGNVVELGLNPSQWRVEKTTVDGFVMIAELRPRQGEDGHIAGDGGRAVRGVDVVTQPLSLALFDVPNALAASSTPMILLAATAGSGWRREPVEINFGGQSIKVDPARGKSLLGQTEAALGAAAADLVDERHSVIVALLDDEQWLTSCNDDALAAGENLAIVGSELIQFGNAEPLGGGRFRLSHLLRGRGGSEWASAEHAADEPFCLLKAAMLQPVALPNWSIGATLNATAPGGSSTSMVFLGEGVRPPAPVNLTASRDEAGNLSLSWTRRSRRGFAWVDGIDVPLGEASEQYRVTLAGSSGSLELTVTQPSLTITATDLVAIGEGLSTIEVRQIGDIAVSRPAQLTITLF